MEERGHDLSSGSAAAGRSGCVLDKANRHGLIAGATGTGKTVTLQGLAEGFSAAGVPVFVADVKGDLAGMAMAGSPDRARSTRSSSTARAARSASPTTAYADNPVVFWDLFGEQGHPIRTTVSEMGPLLLARLMGLNETQEGVLNIAFRVADEQGLLLLDLDDLQAMLVYCAEQAADADRPIRQCHQGDASARSSASCSSSRARAATISSASRRSTIADFMTRRRERPRHGQHPRRRQADGRARGSTPPSCSGCCPSCSRSCPRSAIPTSRSSSSSSTRRICCSTTRPRRCSRRSSRSSG